MSDTNSALANIFNERSFNIHHREYRRLRAKEIEEVIDDEAAEDVAAGMIKTAYSQKRKFRHLARGLRRDT